MRIISRAISDTFSGQVTAIFTVIVGGVFGLMYLYWDQGRDEALAEVPFYEATIIGALGTLALLLLWNLFCAPFRIEREKRVQAEAMVYDLSKNARELQKYVDKLRDEAVKGVSSQVFDTSVSFSGSTNNAPVHTGTGDINLGKPKRVLTREMADELYSMLDPALGVEMEVVMSDPEAKSLSISLLKELEKRGLAIVSTGDVMFSAPQIGIIAGPHNGINRIIVGHQE